MSCSRERKVIFGITIFCLAISLSKNASIDTTKNDDVNEKIASLLKEDDDVGQATTVLPAQEIKKVYKVIKK